MSMASRVMTLCLPLLLVAICIAPPTVMASNGPVSPCSGKFQRFDWGTGDSWHYNYTYDYQSVRQNGSYHFWIESTDSTTTVMRFDGNGTISWDSPPGRGYWRETGSRVFHTPTLAIASNRASMTIDFTEPEQHHEETYIVKNYTPGYDIYSFPISPGDSWATSLVEDDYYYILLDARYYDMKGNVVSGPQRQSVPLDYEHRDLGEGNLKLGNLTLDVRLVGNEGGARVAYLSAEAENEARVDRFDEKGTFVSRMEVVDWTRAPRVESALRVQTEDWTGHPLREADVLVSNGMGGKTDDDGAFVMKIVKGTYTVRVSKSGFDTQEVTVTFDGDASVFLQLDASGRATAFLWSVAGAVTLTCVGVAVVVRGRKGPDPSMEKV